MRTPPRLAQRLSVLFFAACLAVSFAAPAPAEPLKGNVEESGILPSTPAVPAPIEPMPVPVLPAKKKPAMQKGKLDDSTLKGAAQQDGLSGSAEDGDDGWEKGAPKLDPRGGPLKASVTKEGLGGDPDEADAELMVEWDRWRNRFLHAIQSGMMERLNNVDETNLRWDPRQQAMVSRFPLGTVAWFSCQVTPDRRIVNAKILHTSGFPGYDQAVLDSIHDLQGSSILRYPRNSRRRIVSQVAGIKTADTAEYKFHKFGDVERHRIPGGSY